MGHSKAFLLEGIDGMGDQIIKTLLEEDVNIKPDHLKVPDGESLKVAFIRPGFYWIQDVFETEYAEVKRIKSLLSTDLWKRYKSWGGFEEHREVVLLNKALVALRAKVVSRERPDIFKKSKRAQETKARVSKVKNTEGAV